MRHAAIPSSFFTQHRQRLQAMLPPGSLAVVNTNDIPPTNSDGSRLLMPSSDLFYLTGIEQDETVLSWLRPRLTKKIARCFLSVNPIPT